VMVQEAMEEMEAIVTMVEAETEEMEAIALMEKAMVVMAAMAP
jgi:hypothetical protein